MAFHVIAGAQDTPATIEIRKIAPADLRRALAAGWRDFLAMPSHLALLALIYPLVGIYLAFWSSGANVLPLLYPLMAGFALLGPFAAVGLYEISRRREAGLDTSWRHAFEVLRSPSMPSILALGLLLAIIFLCWLASAQILYQALFGAEAPQSYLSFMREVLTTRHGLTLIVLGNAIGLVFAIVTLCTTVVSFPLLLDRDVGAAVAIATSFRAVMRNPLEMALWGVIVAVALAFGFLTFFVGLAIVVPVLGHATWRLYRALVVPAPNAERNMQAS
jgi:uncharacterized membrane protein